MIADGASKRKTRLVAPKQKIRVEAASTMMSQSHKGTSEVPATRETGRRKCMMTSIFALIMFAAFQVRFFLLGVDPFASQNSCTEYSKESHHNYRGWVMMHTLKAGGSSMEAMLNSIGYGNNTNTSRYIQQLGYVWVEDQNESEWLDGFLATHWKWDGPSFATFPSDGMFRIGMAREPW